MVTNSAKLRGCHKHMYLTEGCREEKDHIANLLIKTHRQSLVTNIPTNQPIKIEINI